MVFDKLIDDIKNRLKSYTRKLKSGDGISQLPKNQHIKILLISNPQNYTWIFIM